MIVTPLQKKIIQVLLGHQDFIIRYALICNTVHEHRREVKKAMDRLRWSGVVGLSPAFNDDGYLSGSGFYIANLAKAREIVRALNPVEL